MEPSPAKRNEKITKIDKKNYTAVSSYSKTETINHLVDEESNKYTYKNDVEIAREEISSEIIKEPVNKIVQVQTKQITSRGETSRVSGNSGQSGMYKVTAYCACMQCCGKTNGITASGTKATANRTIAAPSTFAFGTKVVINGQLAFGTQVIINGHTYTVEDRGGAIQGNRIDVYMDTHSQALAWGVRYLYVDVIS